MGGFCQSFKFCITTRQFRMQLGISSIPASSQAALMIDLSVFGTQGLETLEPMTTKSRSLKLLLILTKFTPWISRHSMNFCLLQDLLMRMFQFGTSEISLELSPHFLAQKIASLKFNGVHSSQVFQHLVATEETQIFGIWRRTKKKIRISTYSGTWDIDQKSQTLIGFETRNQQQEVYNKTTACTFGKSIEISTTKTKKESDNPIAIIQADVDYLFTKYPRELGFLVLSFCFWQSAQYHFSGRVFYYRQIVWNHSLQQQGFQQATISPKELRPQQQY